MRRVGRGWRLTLAGALIGVSGCELQEVTLTQPEDLVVAEAEVVVTRTLPPGGEDPERVPHLIASVFLHRTYGGADMLVPNAVVTITARASGLAITVPEVEVAECLLFDASENEFPPPPGSCYRFAALPSPFLPGDQLDLEVTTDRGENLLGTATVPGSFALEDLAYEPVPGPDRDFLFCTLPPESLYRISWTPSAGAWAYLAETNIDGLDRIFAPLGIEVPTSLFLDGLAVGEDTDIVFPSEFGVFDRFDLDRELSLLLQEGLPAGTFAGVSVSALDRNWVNWARGGSFNPSGAVRVPSVFGDGTGVFGAAVRQGFNVRIVPPDAEAPNLPPQCGPVEP